MQPAPPSPQHGKEKGNELGYVLAMLLRDMALHLLFEFNLSLYGGCAMTDKLLIDRDLLERIPLDVLKTYGYAQTAHNIESILAAPRQQLAEARDEITQHSNDLALAYMKGGADMRQQRDRLAGLLRMVRQDGWYHPLEEHEIAQIDAALAEVDK